jgi:hypothetical protein
MRHLHDIAISGGKHNISSELWQNDTKLEVFNIPFII